jgi:hypothetical protein
MEKGLRINIMKTVVLNLAGLFLLAITPAVNALVVGQVDDFEDSTLQGWSGGAEYTNISTGGPAGTGDNYLEISRTLSTFHLGALNTTTWTGNYLAAGIQAIEMDANSISVDIGPTDLSLRIMIIGPGGNFSTTTPVTVTTGAGWQHISFGLTPSDLVHVTGSAAVNAPDGPGILTDTLANVTRLLLRHDPAPVPEPPGTHPQHVRARLGIDNITAILGPAPSYDVAWTFDNATSQSYILDSFEPVDVALGTLGVEDPTLLLYLGKRYQVTVLDDASHPFEVLAKGASSGEDTVLLSMKSGVTGTMEDNSEVEWVDNDIGTVAFTLTNELYNAMIVPNKRPGYRCGAHVVNMRGDFDICTAPLDGDINGDCEVNIYDFALFALDWLKSNITP